VQEAGFQKNRRGSPSISITFAAVLAIDVLLCAAVICFWFFPDHLRLPTFQSPTPATFFLARFEIYAKYSMSSPPHSAQIMSKPAFPATFFAPSRLFVSVSATVAICVSVSGGVVVYLMYLLALW